MSKYAETKVKLQTIKEMNKDVTVDALESMGVFEALDIADKFVSFDINFMGQVYECTDCKIAECSNCRFNKPCVQVAKTQEVMQFVLNEIGEEKKNE